MPLNNPVDRSGTFRAEIREFGVFEADSGAVAVNLVVNLLEFWNGEAWDDWREYACDAEGSVWIVKKDGSDNERAIESLCQHTGWDGDLRSIADGSWLPTLCQVVVKQDDYEGKTRFKIAFVNGHNSTPGGQIGNVTTDKAKLLQDRYGSRFRAIAGNAKLNAPKDTDKKKPPTPKRNDGLSKAIEAAKQPAGSDDPPW